MSLKDMNQVEVSSKAIHQIMDAVNIMGSDKKVAEGIIKELQVTHRTLQQNFWRVMVEVVRQYSEFRHDLRNEGSVELCKAITKFLDENPQYLPYI